MSESLEALIKNCSHEPTDGEWIQTAEQMRSESGRMEEISTVMHRVLDRLISD